MPRREVRWTAGQYERLQRDAKAAGMTTPDWIRFCCLRAEPGKQRERAQQERHHRDALEQRVGTAERRASPLPTALQLSVKLGVTQSLAASWLHAGVVELGPAGEILIRGVDQKVRVGG